MFCKNLNIMKKSNRDFCPQEMKSGIYSETQHTKGKD